MLIPTSVNTKTVTDLRENTLNLLNEVKRRGHLYIFHRSHPKAVVMSLDEFVKIQAMLEDYMDEKDAEKLSEEPRGKGISFKDIAKKYA